MTAVRANPLLNPTASAQIDQAPAPSMPIPGTTASINHSESTLHMALMAYPFMSSLARDGCL